jgi:acetyl-CoA carboxylase biotin carboxyl carrier protein
MAKKSPPLPQTPANVHFTDTKRVKELILLMAENGLTEIELAEDKSRIVLRRGTVATAVSPAPVAVPHVIAAPQASSAPSPSAPAKAVEEDLIPIKSPMPGTFYSAPGPDAPAYVSVGAPVDEKTVVCIVEAMKVFNPIPSQVRGTIARVLVSNGQAVEFDQPMFLVKPA